MIDRFKTLLKNGVIDWSKRVLTFVVFVEIIDLETVLYNHHSGNQNFEDDAIITSIGTKAS